MALSRHVYFAAVVAFLLAGCTHAPVLPPPKAEFTCDPLADNALMAHDYIAGIKAHQRLLAQDPTNGLARYHLGYAYGSIGEHQKEIDFYEKSIDAGYESEDLYFNLGMAHGEVQQNEKAIRAFKTAIGLNPKNADSYFWLATTYHAVENKEMAKTYFLKAIEIDSQYIDARLNLALLQIEMAEFDEAVQQLKAILKFDPSNEVAMDLIERLKTQE